MLGLNKQQKHFQNKLTDVEKTIWDLEFKRFKTREIREDIRIEFDQARARLAPVEEQLKTLDEKKDKERIEELTKQLTMVTEDANRYLAQMKHIDVEVAGSGPTEEYPDGFQGINQQLDALRELEQMIKDYIKVL
jgi:chromosome segregation ATPase